jgi:hypothetical protein
MTAHGLLRSAPSVFVHKGLQGSTTPSRIRHGDRTGHVTIYLRMTQLSFISNTKN